MLRVDKKPSFSASCVSRGIPYLTGQFPHRRASLLHPLRHHHLFSAQLHLTGLPDRKSIWKGTAIGGPVNSRGT